MYWALTCEYSAQSRAGESFYLRVYGKLNHNMRCTLRGYRNLMGDFTGNTIYTGFKKIYTGKSQVLCVCVCVFVFVCIEIYS